MMDKGTAKELLHRMQSANRPPQSKAYWLGVFHALQYLLGEIGHLPQPFQQGTPEQEAFRLGNMEGAVVAEEYLKEVSQ